jgi:hypothetical protein
MSFEVTVTPTIYNVEVEVNPSVQPFDVVVEVGEVPNLSLTTNGDSGASTYVGGVLNIPEYTLDGLGGVPESRTITINGVEQDLSADISFSVSGGGSSVTIGTPANGLSIDSNQVLSLAVASGSQTGALSSTDWSTFNGKQNAIGFTAENVANKASNLTSPDNTKYPTTQAVSTALSGKQDNLGFTPENVANKSTQTTLGTSDTLYPTQNAVKSYVDTGLSGKQNTLTNPITGTGTSGQVSFWNGTSSQTGDNGLFWDNTNKGLGIGTATPDKRLHIKGDNTSSDIVFETNTYTTKGYFANYQGSTLQLSINRRIDGVFSNTAAASSAINLVALNNAGY